MYQPSLFDQGGTLTGETLRDGDATITRLPESATLNLAAQVEVDAPKEAPRYLPHSR